MIYNIENFYILCVIRCYLQLCEPHIVIRSVPCRGSVLNITFQIIIHNYYAFTTNT
jgi:hypothetical protein